MTQEELALKAKVTQGYISQLESGAKKDIGAKVAVRLAEALGVPVTGCWHDRSSVADLGPAYRAHGTLMHAAVTERKDMTIAWHLIQVLDKLEQST